jgi:hypothetical protein
MTLKIKIKKAGYYSLIIDEEIEVIEKIADDFAMEFATFIADENYDLDFWVHNSDIKILLEIFKKQKGL